MALISTLYRFHIGLSDIDRGVYETLDFRVAMHPSESPAFLLTRVLAYALSYEDGIEFSPGGLSDSDQPALYVPGQHGSIDLWIEIGNPAARKLHKAAKASRRVKVYTYKDPKLLIADIAAHDVHRADEIEIQAFPQKALDRLAEELERDNEWSLMVSERTLTVTIRDHSESIEL